MLREKVLVKYQTHSHYYPQWPPNHTDRVVWGPLGIVCQTDSHVSFQQEKGLTLERDMYQSPLYRIALNFRGS